MQIFFAKYHGTGNDFIVIDNRDNKLENVSERWIRAICERRFGIGADGLIILKRDRTTDFFLDYYNSDGKPGGMCGNGARCAVAFALKYNIINTSRLNPVFSTSDGIHKSRILDNNLISININNISAEKIKKILDGYYINTGSPHFIIFAKNIEQFDIKTTGSIIRHNKKYFPEGTNVNFVEINEKDKLYVRTYERGVENETLSCGTGAVASAIAYSLTHNHNYKKYTILTKGGKLYVNFNKKQDNHITDIWLTGETHFVFEGYIENKIYKNRTPGE